MDIEALRQWALDNPESAIAAGILDLIQRFEFRGNAIEMLAAELRQNKLALPNGVMPN